MLIISKKKDYYDYLQGIYGVDDKLVLDRRTASNFSKSCIYNKITLYIGGFLIEGLYSNGKCYYGKDLESFNKDVKYWDYQHGRTKENSYCIIINNNESFFYKKPELDKNKINEKFGKAILIESWGGDIKGENKYYYSYPKLLDLNIQSLFTPQEMWIMLSSWLSSQIKDPIPNPPQTNKEKILAHGFDLKHSFRNTK